MSLVIQSRVELCLFASKCYAIWTFSNNFDIPIEAATCWWSHFSPFYWGRGEENPTESSGIPPYFIAIIVPAIQLVCQLLLLPVLFCIRMIFWATHHIGYVCSNVQYSASNVHNWPPLHLNISFKFCLLITFSEMEHDIRINGTIFRLHTHSLCGKTIPYQIENWEWVKAWSGIEICILQWLAFVNSFSMGATKNNSWYLRDIAMTNTWEMRL